MSLKTILEPVTADDYLEAAKAAMRFIDTRKEKGPEGIFWSLRDAETGHDQYYDPICMYSGCSGIICFLLKLHELTGEQQYLDEAKEGGKYLIYRWYHARDLRKNFSKYAFSTGYSGAAYALIALYRATGDVKYRQTVEDIISMEMKEAKRPEDGQGYTWSTYPGIVGNAGTILFLLYAAKELDHPEWTAFAEEAGRIFLGKARDMGDGMIVYSGVDPKYFHSGSGYIDPNFPMGTGGIGFTLMRLYEETGNEEFREAVRGVAEYMEHEARPIGNGVLLPHALPDRPNLFYLGYCHGPAGTCRFFYKMYEMTGDSSYLDWCEKFAEGIIAAGAPEIHSEGYWNTYNVCCGTAGMTNLFVGLYGATGKEKYRQYALRTGRVLLGNMSLTGEADGLHACWYLALDRVAPKVITSPVGLFDGAAGIGTMLLQIYMMEKGEFHYSRPIDDPFPSSF